MLQCRRLALSSRHHSYRFLLPHTSTRPIANRNIVPSLRVLHERGRLWGVLISARHASTERSKVEDTLKMIKEDLQLQQAEAAKAVKLVQAADDTPKPALTTRVLNELKHYYHGFRLLALETKLSSKYLWTLLRGKSLSRRERQQLIRTVSDLFRLFPFAIFIIVPFMEFALPFFIKFFPNMLPSTFQEASKEEKNLRNQLKVRLEMAKFLQDTLEEIGMERKAKSGEEPGSSKAHEFAQFIKKTRTEGGYVSNTELFKFSKLFEDELTLDNLAMSQLRALCRILHVGSLGSPEILRFQLNMKLRELRADDRQIIAEGGIDALSVSDLQQACRARGMRFLGVSEHRLRDQLRQWLELSLNDKVPGSLLLMSRVLTLPEDLSFADRLKALVAQLPPGIAEQTKQKLTELEGGKVDFKERLDLIRSIETAIAEERKTKDEQVEVETQKMKAKKEKEVRESFDQVVQSAKLSVDQVKEAIMDLSSGPIPAFADTTKSIDKKKQAEAADSAVHVDPKDLESIEDILHGSPIHEAKHDITELKEKVIEHAEDLIEVGSLGGEHFRESKGARRLRDRVNAMISKVDSLVTELEDEKRDLDQLLVDPAAKDAAEKKEAKLVRIADLLESLHRLQKVTDDAKRQRIEQVLKAIDHDTDGVVDANLVLEVIELLGKHTDVKISASQMGKIISMLQKEDHVEALVDKLQGGQLLNDDKAVIEPRITLTRVASDQMQTGASPSTTATTSTGGKIPPTPTAKPPPAPPPA